MTAAPVPDPRAARASQGALTVVILGGFVFRAEWAIVVATLLALADAAMGPADGPVGTLFTRALGPRLRTANRSVGSRNALRDHSMVVAAALLVATLLVFAGLGGVAWILALLAALVTAAAGGAGWFLGVEVAARRGRRG